MYLPRISLKATRLLWNKNHFYARELLERTRLSQKHTIGLMPEMAVFLLFSEIARHVEYLLFFFLMEQQLSRLERALGSCPRNHHVPYHDHYAHHGHHHVLGP